MRLFREPFGFVRHNALLAGAGGAVIVSTARRTTSRLYNLPGIANRVNPILKNIPGMYHVHHVKEIDGSRGRNTLFDAIAWKLEQDIRFNESSSSLFVKTEKFSSSSNEAGLIVQAKADVYVSLDGFSVRLIEKDPPSNNLSFSQAKRENIFEIVCPAGATYQNKVKSALEAIVKDFENRQELLLWSPEKNGFSGWSWRSQPFRHPMSLDQLRINAELKNELRRIVQEFKDGKDWYQKQGVVWKTGFLLYGLPGCGKTSLAAALARELRCDIYNLPLKNLTDEGLSQLNCDMKSRGIVLIEDADSFPVLHRRNLESDAMSNEIKQPNFKVDRPGGTKLVKDTQDDLTLSAVLNVLDGVISTSAAGRLFILTTNDRSRLDPALYRPGRLDHHLNMSNPSADDILQAFDVYDGVSDRFKDRLRRSRPMLRDIIQKDKLQMADVKSKILKHKQDVSNPDVAANNALDEILLKANEE